MKDGDEFIAKKDLIINSHLIWIKGKSYKLFNIAEKFRYHTFTSESYEENGYKVDLKLVEKNSVYDYFYTKKELRKQKLKKLNACKDT